MRKPTAEERARIAEAVHAAEGGTSGEIVTIVAARSDTFHDVALLWALLAALLVPALFAAWPALPSTMVAALTGGWGEADQRDLMLLVLVATAAAFALATLALMWLPLRLALTPKATRRRRVHTRALDLFRVGTEGRTTGKTGILIYLSLAERMAEIVADEGIHAKVADTAWGDAMLALVAEVRHGRIADGMIAAVGQVGMILAAHLPQVPGDVNELPDRLIEL